MIIKKMPVRGDEGPETGWYITWDEGDDLVARDGGTITGIIPELEKHESPGSSPEYWLDQYIGQWAEKGRSMYGSEISSRIWGNNVEITISTVEEQRIAATADTARQKTWNRLSRDQKILVYVSERQCYCGASGIHTCEYVGDVPAYWDDLVDSCYTADEITDEELETPPANF